MIYDCFTYNGESDILRLHLGCLGGVVDKFIIVEANQTFTGQPKPLYFFRDQRYFKPWWHMIEYYVVRDWEDESLWELARTSPNTTGAEHWKREFYIKESMKKALAASQLQDDDVVFLGDVDEIWQPIALSLPAKLKLSVYTYYLNNKSDEEFWGTLVAPWGYLKDKVLNHERSRKDIRSEDVYGWHFTSMGGLKEVQRKLNDSYTPDSYNMNIIPGYVEECVKERKDLLNRPFTYTFSEEDWPRYLKEQRKKYQHLLWQK